METRTIQLISCGDELLAGVGDPRALGWLGRVLARTAAENTRIASYTLASPHEGTEALAARWMQEVKPRLDPEAENRLIIALSAEDIARGLGTARSRLNLANVLDAAAQMSLNTLVVGPPPSIDPLLSEGIAELSAAFRDVTTRRRNSYVDMYTPLAEHEGWHQDLAANAGTPGQVGYGLMAWVVLHRGWYEWLALPSPSM